MIAVKPGIKYYWQDYEDHGMGSNTVGDMDAADRHDALKDWVEANVPKGRWWLGGEFVEEIAFTFEDEADAITFKMTFGL